MSRSFEVKIDINSSPENVWKALTEAEEIAKWFAPEVRVEPGESMTHVEGWAGTSSDLHEVLQSAGDGITAGSDASGSRASRRKASARISALSVRWRS